MPLYEYVCLACGSDFEALSYKDATDKCELCGSVEIQKKLSVFAVNKSAARSTPSCADGCGGGFSRGSCGSGMCGLN